MLAGAIPIRFCEMAKRRKFNMVSGSRNSQSNSQPQEQQPQHSEEVENVQQAQEQMPHQEEQPVQQQVQHSSEESIPRKKVRGHTTMTDIWELSVGDGISVRVNNFIVPIGVESGYLCQFIGTMVRRPDMAPINYKNWRELPNRYKDDMWNTLELKFRFRKHDSEECLDENSMKILKTWALQDAQTKWRQWKNELKNKLFDEDKRPEQMALDCKDSRVNIEQFKALATYWLSDEAKAQSETNKKNRSNLKDPHCTGTRSFARIGQDLAENNNGTQPTRADMYIKSRTRKDGNIVTAQAEIIVERLQQKLSENSSQNIEESSWENDVFSQVRGPEQRGRVRCMGHIPPCSSKRPSQPLQNNEDVQGMKTEIANLRKTMTNILSFIQAQNPNLDVESLFGSINPEAADAGSSLRVQPNEDGNNSNNQGRTV